MKLLALDLASMLEFGGYVPPGVHDDPDAMDKIGYLCDLINSHVERPAPQVGASWLSKQDIDAERRRILALTPEQLNAEAEQVLRSTSSPRRGETNGDFPG